MRQHVMRIATSVVDVVKDTSNAVLYLNNAMNSINAWQLGMLYFVGIYTTVGMFLPALAYAIIFNSLVSDRKEASLFGIRKFKLKTAYTFFSILLSPIVTIIR